MSTANDGTSIFIDDLTEDNKARVLILIL
jgi:hypothetical protein